MWKGIFLTFIKFINLSNSHFSIPSINFLNFIEIKGLLFFSPCNHIVIMIIRKTRKVRILPAPDFVYTATKMNEWLESKSNSRAAARLEGPSR